MPTIRFTVSTLVSPQKLLAALTDFSSDRPRRWRNLDPASYQVHAAGATWVDVTEGARMAGRVWERSRYDWSQPGVVSSTLIDSNTFARGSSWTYQIAPESGGGSRVTCTVRRIGKGFKGRVIVALVGIFGRPVLQRDFELMLANLA